MGALPPLFPSPPLSATFDFGFSPYSLSRQNFQGGRWGKKGKQKIHRVPSSPVPSASPGSCITCLFPIAENKLKKKKIKNQAKAQGEMQNQLVRTPPPRPARRHTHNFRSFARWVLSFFFYFFIFFVISLLSGCRGFTAELR